jgi:U6 snRNA-associated Sm-like protein LSm3
MSQKLFADTVKTQAYDSHCNLILGEVEETIYVVDEDEEDEEPKVCGR